MQKRQRHDQLSSSCTYRMKLRRSSDQAPHACCAVPQVGFLLGVAVIATRNSTFRIMSRVAIWSSFLLPVRPHRIILDRLLVQPMRSSSCLSSVRTNIDHVFIGVGPGVFNGSTKHAAVLLQAANEESLCTELLRHDDVVGHVAPQNF